MTHARRRLQRIARLAAVGGLLCGGLMVTDAMASEASAPRGGPAGTSGGDGLGARLVLELGTSRTAGTWIGSDGRQVVAVTDTDAAAEVERAGARAEVVRYSMSRLRSATESLSEAQRVPGTAWAVDYASNKVVVQADSTVSSADWSRLSDVAKEIGGFVQMQRTGGAFTTRVNGAEPILAANGRCSVGFNVTNGRSTFVLTAGHCGPVGTAWFKDRRANEPVGATTASSFPGTDFSLVQYRSGEAPGGTNVVNIGGGKGVQITGSADPSVGQQVFRSGSTTGLRSGKVTGLNATVNYPEGTVSGLIETTVCAEPGDSGGPLFAEGLALGVTSGGNGDCRTGGTTFFQPVTKAMAALGVNLTGGATPAGGNGAGQAPLNPAALPPPPAGTDTPPGPGQANGPTTVSSIFGPRTIAPGLVVIAVSVIGLIATRSIWSAQDRRRYRTHYSQSWS
ncbi:S1 family peptidase [Streptomyces sp. NPDC005408]|uniref:S1 family peptidase n=1 Tax=Streptomyces sp. NPDC005408 TaxID=3155341 RepID=UPI0033AD14B7